MRVPGDAGGAATATASVDGTDVLRARRDFLRGQGTYAAEMEARRRQERLDEELARRMQFGALLEDDDERRMSRPAMGRRPSQVQSWGIGNAGTHFLNDDFVQTAAGIVRGALDEAVAAAAAYGRRGERESGRRARTRVAGPALDAGLVPNAFGDASVLGVAPSRMPER